MVMTENRLQESYEQLFNQNEYRMSYDQIGTYNESNRYIAFSDYEKSSLMPLFLRGDDMAIRQQLLGFRLTPSPIDDSNYKQPEMKKWVNSSLCNKILYNVKQTDISQSFITIGMLLADPKIPNERLIGSICSKLFNLR